MSTFRHCAHALLGIDPTSQNLQALTDAQAGIIYRDNYWNPMQGDSYLLQELANIVCDFYVNAGTHATSLLQKVMNSLRAKRVVDGALGTASIHALFVLNHVTVYTQYKQERIAYYRDLGAKYPMFLQGWLNRRDG